jgi:hypothetical protein
VNRLMTLLIMSGLLASTAARADDPDATVTPPATLPSFQQVDVNGDGEITPDEASTSGVVIDWSRADAFGRGRLDEADYDQAVENGYVHQADGANLPDD